MLTFSRGLETNFETNKIDKDLFYTNLRYFIDYFIENDIVEPKILFWGIDFQIRERYTLIQNVMVKIRMLDFEVMTTDIALLFGLSVLFPEKAPNIIVNGWIKDQLSKNEIISIINSQI